MSDNKDRLTYRPEPETKQKIERWYQVDNCRSKNEFIEDAINYYADALALKDNTLLPRTVKSVIDGRLGQFEEHMAYLLFKLAVETDIIAALNANAYEWSDAALHALRRDSVRNVKETNGRISFEQHARGMAGDDEWQG